MLSLILNILLSRAYSALFYGRILTQDYGAPLRYAPNPGLAKTRAFQA